MRLLNAADYERIFERAHKSSGKSLTVLARGGGQQAARLGLAIPAKQIRRAVDRNRVKRLIRESFRRHQAVLQGLDVVVIARSGLAGKDSQQVFACLEKHWRRISEHSSAVDRE